MVDRSRFLGAGIPHATTEHAAETSSATEELCEQVLGSHATATAHASLLESFFTILVV